MKNILPLNRTIEIRSDQESALGYGYAVAGDPEQEDERDVVLHWFLMGNATENWAPNVRVTLQKPADVDWDIRGNKAGFLRRVSDNFVTGSHYYVLANCQRTPNRGTTSVSIERPIRVPPHLRSDERSMGQTDVGVCPIFLGTRVVGQVLTRLLETGLTLEAWALRAEYEEPGDETSVELGRHLGKNDESDFADLLDARWDDNCTYITCACTYLAAVPA